MVNLDALGLEGGNQRIMLGLHVGDGRHRIALEIPAGLNVAKRTYAFNPLGGVDHIHFLARPVNQDGANAAHVIINAPSLAPIGFKLVFVFEWRIAGRGKHLDGLVVNPSRRRVI